MGLLQAQLLTFNSSLPVTPYGIASWKILVESQEQRKDVRLLLKGTCSRGGGRPLVARVGRLSQRNLGSLKDWRQIWRHTPDGRAGEKGNAQEAAAASPCSAALLHCLGMKCVCLCGKKFLWRRCVPLLNCPHGPQRVRSAHQDRGRDNAYKLLSSHLRSNIPRKGARQGTCPREPGLGTLPGLCPGWASWKAPRAGFIMACDTTPEEERRQSCDRRFWSRETLLFNREAQRKVQSYHSLSVGIKAVSDLTLQA